MIARAGFGRTGHESSRIIFGSAGLGFVDQDRADEVLPVLLSHGVNHLDTAAAYGDAELRLAPWLARHRGEFFIATKTGQRSGDGAREELERSLERLGVDRVDLIQLHNLVEEDEWEQAHSTGGALEALVRARDEGLASAVGVTGHGLRIAGMHLRSLNRFDYDSVLLPCNFLLLQDRRYRSDFEELLTLCTERTVAVQLIKSIARRRWPGPGERSGEAAPGGTDSPGRGDPHGGERLSWYEPLVDQAAIDHAVHYVLGRGEVFLVTSSDFRRLASTLDAAEAAPATPPDDVLSSEARELAMSALFDGADLERI